ncbi:MAG: hypothetical protein ACK5PR_00680 [bacterium]
MRPAPVAIVSLKLDICPSPPLSITLGAGVNIRCFFIGPTDGPARLGPEQRPDHEHNDRRRHPEGVEDLPQGALFTVARNSLASFLGYGKLRQGRRVRVRVV